MPSILFVDDEPNILSGLRRMLRTRRGGWEMAFCESGASALERLAETPVDVVVSDMRMPGMDGAELLTRVRELYPDTVRMILSGHSDQEMTLRAVGPAHRYLAKPCDPVLLTEAIDASLELHSRVRSTEVRRLVEAVDSLPMLPEVYTELVEEMANARACVQTAGKIISRDLGMSAKILQLVNSSFFGLPVRVSDVPHAVALLGLGVIRPLVLTTGVFRQFEGRDLGGFSLARLTDHSMRVAVRARDLASTECEHLSGDDLSDVFLGGLVHDVGRLVLAQHRPGDYARLVSESADQPNRLTDCERELFGATHCEVGGYLLQLWGLPAPLVKAVALHHEPSVSRSDRFEALTAIHAAEVLVDNEADWDRGYLDQVGLGDRPAVWLDAVKPANA
ncbi:Hydrogenase transcriptional regulatory protein hupR1 [Botrimarina colliarenosi]|uniref:Hydrogenase transcriptional regulatory protein hupR1 n=1 Tax=Botrimarina colliarenosi TaxID=2528001 RepID=A0A5C6AIT0_9BACT|nr:response regulator [Botrimarina colliarenosi]TWT99310.1 Hydrogenase transcriptional regulatory protein hupR1 [Botrimarina colliarenosi]